MLIKMSKAQEKLYSADFLLRLVMTSKVVLMQIAPRPYIGSF